MEVSKLTFTPDFQMKTTKPIANRKVGSLRRQKLKEAEANGTLQMCKNRVDIGKLLGIPAGIKTYQYVYNAIKRGEITETLLGVEKDKKVYEYHYRDNTFSFSKPNKNDSFSEFVKNFSVEKNEDVLIGGMEVVIDISNSLVTIKNMSVENLIKIVKEFFK